MSRATRAAKGAVGFRVKSGWAAAVLLAGPIDTPQALDRRIVELSDPDVPETRQPYHAAMGTLEEDEGKIRHRTKAVRDAATRSVAELLDYVRAAGQLLLGAGLVIGSQIDPATIANPHIRAHALEGRLFRTVLEEALQSHGLRCWVAAERNAYKEAAGVLARPEADVKRMLAGLGRSLGGPWRAEEKLAALAAWMV